MRAPLIAFVLIAAAGASVASAQAPAQPTAPAEAPAADPALLLFYPGSYVTDGPVVTIAMGADGQLTARVGDSQALPMRLVAPDEFAVDQAKARVVFQRENGRVNSVTVHHRGRELQGRRHTGK